MFSLYILQYFFLVFIRYKFLKFYFSRVLQIIAWIMPWNNMNSPINLYTIRKRLLQYYVAKHFRQMKNVHQGSLTNQNAGFSATPRNGGKVFQIRNFHNKRNNKIGNWFKSHCNCFNLRLLFAFKNERCLVYEMINFTTHDTTLVCLSVCFGSVISSRGQVVNFIALKTNSK